MSPKGFDTVQEAVKAIESAKNAGGSGDFRRWFSLREGESATVRFLDTRDEVKWSWCHEVPVEGRTWGRMVPCRDQDEAGRKFGEPCPACEQGSKRKFKGWINLIWRNGPTFERDTEGRLRKGSDGKPIVAGAEDQVAVWNQGVQVFEDLDGLDVTYKGITSRDFVVTRRGGGMNTKYLIVPADVDGGPRALSDGDKKLAETKYDLTPEVTPPPYDSYFDQPGRDGDGAKPELQPADVSPFRKQP